MHRSFPHPQARLLSAWLAVSALSALSACGGGEQPPPATVSFTGSLTAAGL
jgi:hypothetical protein